LISGVRHDDGDAARSHLAAGRPIYYTEDDTPAGLLIKKHPDGRRELVKFDEEGDQVIREHRVAGLTVRDPNDPGTRELSIAGGELVGQRSRRTPQWPTKQRDCVKR
jgi:hypothetical protein